MKKKRHKRAAAAGQPGTLVRRRRRRTAGSQQAEAPEGTRRTIRRLRLQLARAHQEVEQLRASAERDFLLDIVNRRGFIRELNRTIAYIKRYGAVAALIVLDVDHLKPINDSFGHAAGDEVLKAVARTLTAQVRASDVVGRLGGDEFGVVLWHLAGADAALKAAALEHAVDGLNFAFGRGNVRAGASAGVAVLNADSDAAGALEHADRAMYLRKAQRRG